MNGFSLSKLIILKWKSVQRLSQFSNKKKSKSKYRPLQLFYSIFVENPLKFHFPSFPPLVMHKERSAFQNSSAIIPLDYFYDGLSDNNNMIIDDDDDDDTPPLIPYNILYFFAKKERKSNKKGACAKGTPFTYIIIISSTCSRNKLECSFFIPLKKQVHMEFHVGGPSTWLFNRKKCSVVEQESSSLGFQHAFLCVLSWCYFWWWWAKNICTHFTSKWNAEGEWNESSKT